MQDRPIAPRRDSSSDGPTGQRRTAFLWIVSAALSVASLAVTVRLQHRAGIELGQFLMAGSLVGGVMTASEVLTGFRRRRALRARSESIQNIFDSAAPMMMAVDCAGCILDINPAAERMLGYDAADVIGLPPAIEMLGPGEGPRILVELQRRLGVEAKHNVSPRKLVFAVMNAIAALPEGQPLTIQADFRRKQEGLFRAEIHITCLRDDQGRMQGLVLAALDGLTLPQPQVTEAKTRSRDYRASDLLLDSVPDALCGIDGDGLVNFANPAAGRLLRVPASSLMGKPIHELLHGLRPVEETCGAECSLRRATARQVASAGEDTIYRKDGTTVQAEYLYAPVFDRGKFAGSVLSFRDVTHRYALGQMKDEFISTVSHELRAPLTAIRGALGLLSSGMLVQIKGKAANLLRIADSNTERLMRLINDILDLNRIESGREPTVFRPVQLSEVIRQAVDGMQTLADAAGVRLECNATPAEISGDPDRLVQVLTNLLSNAIKFSEADSAVSILVRREASGITLSVVDEGRGIPVDKLEAIFGRFQQVDVSDSRQRGGTGLGLAICRTIVSQHGGRIWAECNPNRGSTFRVFLPYKPALQLQPKEHAN